MGTKMSAPGKAGTLHGSFLLKDHANARRIIGAHQIQCMQNDLD
jgi:hypothetical protein